MSKPANPVTLPLADYSPKHFLLAVVDRVATVTLNRPERKNPLTFESYRELTDFFRACAMDDEVKTIVVTGAGGNFSSGGDVFEIIGPLIQMDTKGLTAFTRMTGDLVKAMRACPQPIVAAVEGICAGAGAIVAMASDLRLAATGAKVAFLFNKVGLAGCDMGACAILPRIIGQSRASELLYTGRFMTAEEGERWGFFSRIVTPDSVLPQAQLMATRWLSRFPAPDVERAMSDVVLLNRDRSLRIGALWTLSEIGTVSALPAVDQAMQDPDASVAGMARDVANSIRGRARDAGNR